MSKKLAQLIEEYGKLRDLIGYTPQSRGQRMNSFIAEMLLCSGIKASANIRSHGEIDVTFALNGRHFIVESKWEADPTDTGPIAKLQKRLRQRLGGTIGIFVSMAGYTDDALKDLKDGEQLTVICLTRVHLEAMLSGFIPPEELISLVVEKASQQGIGFVEISNLFDPPYISEMNPDFEPPTEISQLVTESIQSFEAHTIISSLPGHNGIAELKHSSLLVANDEGIFLTNLKKKKVSSWFTIPNCHKNPLVHSDGSVFIIRKAGIARITTDKKIEFVAGGLIGNVCLSSALDGSVWAFSGGDSVVSDISPQIVSITNNLGYQMNWAVDYPGSSVHIAAHVDGQTMLVCGNNGLALVSPSNKDEIISARDNHFTNPRGLTRLADDRLLFACNNVELWEMTLSTHEFRQIAKLRPKGLIYEITASRKMGGYLSYNYEIHSGQLRGIIVRWKYPFHGNSSRSFDCA